MRHSGLEVTTRACRAPRAIEELLNFFSILLRGPGPSVEEADGKTSGCHAHRKHRTD